MPATIFALSSGAPPAGVAVVRLSGPAALATLEALAGPLPPPRRATLRRFRDPATGTLVDTGLALAFAAPASATGEDMAELHLHGGPAVVAAMLAVLAARPGHRLAEPGEFARRAFHNGKLDLSQAEGLADLIAAATEAQRVQALAQAGGALRQRVEAWREDALALLADAEADLDFSDEADVAPDPAARERLAMLTVEIDTVLARPGGERIRDGLTIALVGAPNVGKSSLLNALARREAAIVSDVPGTTRDVVEVAMDLGGLPVTLVDTAGLRESSDPVEAEGVRRARARAASADLVLHLSEEPIDAPLGQLVRTKIDRSGLSSGPHAISARTGAGLDALEAWLAGWARSFSPAAEPALVTHARHREALGHAHGHLREAAAEPDPVLRAEALRLAARALGRVTGAVDVEQVLDRIFARFCIGK